MCVEENWVSIIKHEVSALIRSRTCYSLFLLSCLHNEEIEILVN